MASTTYILTAKCSVGGWGAQLKTALKANPAGSHPHAITQGAWCSGYGPPATGKTHLEAEPQSPRPSLFVYDVRRGIDECATPNLPRCMLTGASARGDWKDGCTFARPRTARAPSPQAHNHGPGPRAHRSGNRPPANRGRAWLLDGRLLLDHPCGAGLAAPFRECVGAGRQSLYTTRTVSLR